jgi:hypothetical protein
MEIFVTDQATIKDAEILAIERTLPDMGALLKEMGLARPASDWSREEALRMIYVLVSAYQRHMGDLLDSDIPF